MLLWYHTNKDYNFGVIEILNPRYNINKKCHILYDYGNGTYDRLLFFIHDFLNNRKAIKNINNHKFINIHLNDSYTHEHWYKFVEPFSLHKQLLKMNLHEITLPEFYSIYLGQQICMKSFKRFKDNVVASTITIENEVEMD